MDLSPLQRLHPAIIAQAAATAALLTGGRFTLGVGTGEALSEHILGAQWPPAEQRLDMLEEAVHIIRELLTGQLVTHDGDYMWPTDSIPGEAMQLLPLPRHFGELVPLISEDMISAPCGPDPSVHADGARAFRDAGFDEVYVGQVGGAPEEFFEFYAEQVLPRLRGA